MANAGTVTVDFAAETAKFTAELKKVNSSLKGLESGFSSMARVAKSALAVFSVGALTAFVKQAANAADEFGKMSDRLGVTTDRLKAFQIAANDAGVSTDAANKLLSESQKRLGEAATGSGEAAKFIKLLGLNVKELQQLSPDELFKRYSEAIGGLSTRSEQLAAASALMGRSATEAFNFIASGSQAVDEAAGFVEKFGLALSRVEIKQIENANDALARLRTVSESAGQRIAVGLSPAVEFFADRILEASGNTKGLQEFVEKFSAAAIGLFELAANAANSLQAAFFGIAAGGARILQALTFGDVSEAFGASVKENLDKAKEAMAQIKSIEQIQLSITNALESSRARAAQAVAEQEARERTRQATGTTLEGGIQGINAAQMMEAQAAAARAAAAEQIKIQKDITSATQTELTRQANAFQNMKEFELRVSRQAAEEEKALRLSILDQAITTFAFLATSGKKGARIQKAIALAEAIRNTYVAVTKQLSGGDPYTAIPRAIAVGALGAAQVAAILRTPDTGGSGFSPAGGGGGPTFNDRAPAQQTPNGQPFGATSQPAVNVVISGNVGWDRRVFDEIIRGIRDAVDGREVMLMGPDSAQAQRIRAGA